MTDLSPLLVRTDDGVDLALWRVPPDRPTTRAPVLLVHGTFSNHRFFHGTRERGFARALARRGFDAWVAELRGHGRSGAAGRGEAWRFEDWIRHDAPALVRGVVAHSGADRVLWVGHSAGGVIGAALLGLGGPEADRVAGLVMVGAPAPTGLGLMQRPIAAAGYLLARLFGRFPARLLGIGPEDEHLGIFAQWMRWNLRGEWHGDDGTDYFANCRRVRVPVLALAGGGDWLVAPPAVCEDLLEACGSGDRMFVACGRAEGFAEDYDHNRVLVSTPARGDVWPLIADWLESRSP